MLFSHKPFSSSSSSTSPTFLPQKPSTQILRKATILEVNLISAQNLTPACKSSTLQTYVVAYIDPTQKLSSRIDGAGNENPTWNDKFIFSIDGDYKIKRPNSCVVFEIYQVQQRLFRKDKKIGVVHVLLENMIHEDHVGSEGVGGKFMAFNVRSPSGMPQGILNIGMVSLDGVFRETTPSFFGTSLAIDYRKLAGGD